MSCPPKVDRVPTPMTPLELIYSMYSFTVNKAKNSAQLREILRLGSKQVIEKASFPAVHSSYLYANSFSTGVVPDMTVSNPAGFRNSKSDQIRKNLFSNHRTIHPTKLMASTMLSSAIERRTVSGSTVQCFLCYVTVCQFLMKLWNGNGFCIFSSG